MGWRWRVEWCNWPCSVSNFCGALSSRFTLRSELKDRSQESKTPGTCFTTPSWVQKRYADSGNHQGANEIGKYSPDSVVVSKEGVELGWEGIGVEEGSQRLIDGLWKKMEGGENMMEGIRAFVEKRNARWVDSKL